MIKMKTTRKIRIENKRLGIVGGLGPETSCSLCLQLNNRIRKLNNCQPDIVMENVAVPLEIERKLINGNLCKDMFDLLAKAVIRLNRAEVGFIVIPCNTVHVFIDDLRKISKKPIVSIIEECAKECKRRNIKCVGLLATATTVNQNLHSKELKKIGIKILLPEKQETISKIILRILDNKAGEKEKKALMKIISQLKERGAEVIILGCTDLDILISENQSSLPIIDTTKVLENAVVGLLS